MHFWGVLVIPAECRSLLLKERSFLLPDSVVKIAEEETKNAISTKQKHATGIFRHSAKWPLNNYLHQAQKPAALRNVEKEIKSFILEQYHRLNIINIIEKDALIKRACGKVKMN